MQADLNLSTEFVTAQHAHQIRLVVGLKGESPSQRAPINTALVLDRSGSMNGEPLHAAKDAAAQFVQYLGPQDLISVVAFDDEVITMADPGACQPETIAHVMRAIQSIPPGGRTNLSGGWLKGRHHVESNTVEGVNRILLLTDGLANQGITDPDKLRLMTQAARRKGITTTCIGFGPHFNEDLLQAMADAGGGNFWYVESHDQMGPIFEEEIEGLVSLAAQNVEVTLTLSHDRAAGVTFPQDYLTYQSAEGASVSRRPHDRRGGGARQAGAVRAAGRFRYSLLCRAGAVGVVADRSGLGDRTIRLSRVPDRTRSASGNPHCGSAGRRRRRGHVPGAGTGAVPQVVAHHVGVGQGGGSRGRC